MTTTDDAREPEIVKSARSAVRNFTAMSVDREIIRLYDHLADRYAHIADRLAARDAELAKLRATLEMREGQITELVSANAIETSRLRAERAEVVALLANAKPREYGEAATEWRRQRDALLDKLRGTP